MLRSDQIADYFFLKHELPNVECKGPGNLSDNPLLGKVVRAAIGMANKQDGGIVIIGIAEHDDHTLYPDGLTDEQLATWSPDLLACHIHPNQMVGNQGHNCQLKRQCICWYRSSSLQHS